MSKLERLEDERWELLNSYGYGSYHDGLVTERLRKVEAEIERLKN